MALIDSAADGLLGAVVSGGFATGFFWWTNRGRRGQLTDAWRKQADELDDRLSQQYLSEIAHLRRQLKDCQGRLNGKRGGDD